MVPVRRQIWPPIQLSVKICPPENDPGPLTNMAERRPSSILLFALYSILLQSHYRISSEITGRMFFETCTRCSPSILAVHARKMVPVCRQIWPPTAVFAFHRYRISSETIGGILLKPCIRIALNA